MEDHQQLTLEAIELQTGHYFSLMHALAVAMARCVIWRYNGTDQKYDILQLFRFAEEFDKEHPIQDRSFYMVSSEGAIGVTPGMEYLTKWLFIPDMDEASIEKLQADIRQLEEQAKAEEEAKRQAEEAAQREAEEAAKREAEEKARQEAEEKARQEAEAQAAAQPKFCFKCGTPFKNLTSKFCENCGAPRKL